ncbi:MAG: hypothetical protein C4555_01025 [Dehalococcoidia bacterium]|nr:MAG: hypothetical protein C4555_01025 [Dehalococcoidia bacterium]
MVNIGATPRKLGGILSVCLLILLLAVPAAGCQSEPPPLTLTITQPAEGDSITKSPYQVRGTVSDPKASVTVNGVRGSITPNGFYGANIELTPGENTITVVATRGTETTTRTMTVTFSTAR